MEPDGIVEVRGLRRVFSHGSVAALDGVDLRIERGERIAIVGPSGSGKSTLLNLLAGLDAPTGGSIAVVGVEAPSRAGWARLRAETIGIVFQAFHLIPTLTSLRNVMLPMQAGTGSRAARRARAAELLARVNLGHRRDHYPPELSGGERQRVAVARALANRPKLLLADEPTGNLDRDNGRAVIDLLSAATREAGAALVIVTHDRELMGDDFRILELVAGRVVQEGEERGDG